MTAVLERWSALSLQRKMLIGGVLMIGVLLIGLMLRIAPGPVEVITSGAPLAGAQHED